MTKIKICGLRVMQDVQFANELKPDYIGFVFAPKSKRCITLEQAKRLKAALLDDIKSVGVFVDAPCDAITALIAADVIDVVQLHGKEDEAYIAALRGFTDTPIIKAFRIDCIADIKKAEKSSADYILLDNGTGGTGQCFDWSLVTNIKKPFFLAGGLNHQNVSKALQQTCPYAVDTSSGVETDAYKDHFKMEQFIQTVRGQ